jgi:hypothetical protein
MNKMEEKFDVENGESSLELNLLEKEEEEKELSSEESSIRARESLAQDTESAATHIKDEEQVFKSQEKRNERNGEELSSTLYLMIVETTFVNLGY